MKVIIMDVDQVLLDCISRLRDYMLEHEGKKVSSMPTAWDLSKWMDCDSEGAMDTVRSFHSNWMFGTLDAMPGASNALNRLVRKGYGLIFVTACGDSPITTALRKVNLYSEFGDIFLEEHFVPVNGSKLAVLQDLAARYDVRMFVDDRPKNLEAGIEAGVPVALMKAPHNRDQRDKYTCAYSWYELLDIVEGLENVIN